MIPTESLIPFVVASALLSIAPGPDNIFVLTQSALYGKKSGLLITLGLCTGLIVHTTAVALGVAVLFQTSSFAFVGLKAVGAGYLLYLAWKAFFASAEKFQGQTMTFVSNTALYRRGIIMNITNPKVSIFFLAFLPQFASSDNGAIAPQIFVLGTLFIVIALLVFTLISVLAGSLGSWLNSSPKSQMYLNKTAGIVLALLALKLASSA